MADADRERIKQQVEGTELAFRGIDATIQRTRDVISLSAWAAALAAPAFLGLVGNVGRMKACTIFLPYTLTAMYQLAFSALVLSVLCAFVIHLLIHGFVDVMLRNKEATYRGLATVVVNSRQLESVQERVEDARKKQKETIEELSKWSETLRRGGQMFAAQQVLLIIGYVLAGICLGFLDPARHGCG